MCQQLLIQPMVDMKSVPTTANSTYCKHSTLQHCLRQVLYPIGLTEHSNIMLFSSTEFYFKQWSGVCYEVDCFFTDKKYNVICIWYETYIDHSKNQIYVTVILNSDITWDTTIIYILRNKTHVPVFYSIIKNSYLFGCV